MRILDMVFEPGAIAFGSSLMPDPRACLNRALPSGAGGKRVGENARQDQRHADEVIAVEHLAQQQRSRTEASHGTTG